MNDEEEKDETARPAMKEEVRPQRAEEEEEEDPELEAESRTRDVELDEAPSDKAPMEVQSAIAISHSSNSNKRERVCCVRERQRESEGEEKDKVLPVRSKEPPVKTVGSVGPKGNPGRRISVCFFGANFLTVAEQKE